MKVLLLVCLAVLGLTACVAPHIVSKSDTEVTIWSDALFNDPQMVEDIATNYCQQRDLIARQTRVSGGDRIQIARYECMKP
jgi:hypothetical protein